MSENKLRSAITNYAKKTASNEQDHQRRLKNQGCQRKIRLESPNGPNIM